MTNVNHEDTKTQSTFFIRVFVSLWSKVSCRIQARGESPPVHVTKTKNRIATDLTCHLAADDCFHQLLLLKFRMSTDAMTARRPEGTIHDYDRTATRSN